jgi:hypothetical protein
MVIVITLSVAFFIVMLNVVKLSVVIQSVVMLNVAPSKVLHSCLRANIGLGVKVYKPSSQGILTEGKAQYI